MEEFVVYIMYSKNHNKTYVGFTSSLIKRFASHNTLGKKGWTIKYRPWEVVHIEVYHHKKQAMQREKFLKSGKGRQWRKQNITLQ